MYYRYSLQFGQYGAFSNQYISRETRNADVTIGN